jgi:16S rRNA G966 N2-methylase RsmD
MASARSAKPTPINRAPRGWKKSCSSTECKLHQLSPYIGKLKSSIAGYLVDRYSEPGNTILDPFSGSGTIPLEAALRGRNAHSADVSTYSKVLTLAKLFPPATLTEAEEKLDTILSKTKELATPSLKSVPAWVREFFHPKTLTELLKFAQIVRESGNEFYLACLLGILHHQRPGFLSFPSSHLVPYLRNKNFPRTEFPELYEYRALEPRLRAKIRRAFRSSSIAHSTLHSSVRTFRLADIATLRCKQKFDAIITSPPYMNALDYARDNRLRLWLLNPNSPISEHPATRRLVEFRSAISSLADLAESQLRKGGHCVVVVGENSQQKNGDPLSLLVCDELLSSDRSFKLVETTRDKIPDVRRTRRNCTAVKQEVILAFAKK